MTHALPNQGRRSVALALAAALLVAGAPVAQALGRMVSVIVLGPSTGAAGVATESVGGRVDAPLPIVDGVLAHVPESRVADLSRTVVVVPDRSVHMQSASFSGDSLATAYPAEVGATSQWSQGNAGSGVTVALIDTGVANVPDLAGQVVASADLSPELNFTDGFGHGTFEAGIVAGTGASSNGAYTGVAPGASLMSVKVADASGSTSLGRVLMGVQLVDQSADRFNVRVALLAVDSGSPLPPELDPLTLALRRLWADGIVVVVPAGNEGPNPGTIASPGEDPVLLTAGSVNDQGTASILDDTVSDFSSRGPTRWGNEKPDVAAPGEHIVSLRDPGSTIDQQNPSARVGDSYFKGSGTSMAAAVTAGAAALLLSAEPNLSPDQVKAALKGSANPIPAGDAASVGAGVVNANDATTIGAPDESSLPPVPDRKGKGDDIVPWMQGRDFDWFGAPGIGYRFLARQWGAREWAARAWAARAWDVSQWDGYAMAAREWAARSWDARAWAARAWDARSWDAREWAARAWDARAWAARSWAARAWDARAWDARSWAGADWASRQWTSADWAARAWDARSWDGRTWDARAWTSRTWDARTWDGRTWDAREWSSRTWDAREWSANTWS